MFDPNNLVTMKEFLSSHECDQGFTLEMFIGAMVALVCCPREVESDDFCQFVVGKSHQEWLSKTDLRLARMQINDVISEGFLDDQFDVLEQFDDASSSEFVDKLGKWCRGYMLTSRHLDELWQADIRLLEGLVSKDCFEDLAQCREFSFNIIKQLSEVTSTDNLEQIATNLNNSLAKLHHFVLLFEKLKIEHKID